MRHPEESTLLACFKSYSLAKHLFAGRLEPGLSVAVAFTVEIGILVQPPWKANAGEPVESESAIKSGHILFGSYCRTSFAMFIRLA